MVRLLWPNSSLTVVSWRELFNRLKKRGLHGVKLVVSDDHQGLVAALSLILTLLLHCDNFIYKFTLAQTRRSFYKWDMPP